MHKNRNIATDVGIDTPLSVRLSPHACSSTTTLGGPPLRPQQRTGKANRKGREGRERTAQPRGRGRRAAKEIAMTTTTRKKKKRTMISTPLLATTMMRMTTTTTKRTFSRPRMRYRPMRVVAAAPALRAESCDICPKEFWTRRA